MLLMKGCIVFAALQGLAAAQSTCTIDSTCGDDSSPGECLKTAQAGVGETCQRPSNSMTCSDGYEFCGGYIGFEKFAYSSERDTTFNVQVSRRGGALFETSQHEIVAFNAPSGVTFDCSDIRWPHLGKDIYNCEVYVPRINGNNEFFLTLQAKGALARTGARVDPARATTTIVFARRAPPLPASNNPTSVPTETPPPSPPTQSAPPTFLPTAAPTVVPTMLPTFHPSNAGDTSHPSPPPSASQASSDSGARDGGSGEEEGGGGAAVVVIILLLLLAGAAGAFFWWQKKRGKQDMKRLGANQGGTEMKATAAQQSVERRSSTKKVPPEKPPRKMETVRTESGIWVQRPVKGSQFAGEV